MAEPSAVLRSTLKTSFALTALAAVVLVTPGPVRAAGSGAHLAVGHSRVLSVHVDPAEMRWSGDRLEWEHEVDVEGATFLKPHFVDVSLRAGDRLVVRSATGAVVEEIRGRGPRDLGSFWGLSVPGDRFTLELEMGPDVGRTPFRIDQVIVGDVDLMGRTPDETESVCLPADFEDVICHQDDIELWANSTATVGVMTVGGVPGDSGMSGLWCSGSVVGPEGHVLTSYGCLPLTGACVDVEFVLGYHRSGCGGDALPVADWQSFRCDEVVASSPFVDCEPQLDELDFSLASVVGNPAAEYGFVRPDAAAAVSGEDVFIVQHAQGRPLEVTSGGGADFVVDGMTLRYFGTLDTDAGSQGAPIFREADGRLIGLHHCGGCSTPGDGNRGVLMADIHPLIEGHLCTAELLLRWDGFLDLLEVDGDGDAVVEPGETWQLTPLAVNLSCAQAAPAASLSMAPSASSAGPVYMLVGAVDLGAVGAGETAAASAPIVFQVDPAAACGEQVVLDVTVIEAEGAGPFEGTAPAVSIPTGEVVTTTLLHEDFVVGVPTSWSVEHLGSGTGPASTWTADNPGARSLALTEPFAICDSGALGSDQTMDERLISASVDCGSSSEVALSFQHDFNWAAAGLDEQGDVDVRSTATAGQWVTVASFSGEDDSGAVEVDISAQAAGQADLEVSFHYYDALYEWWWAVDDVFVLDRELQCQGWQPLPVAAFSIPLQVCDGAEVQPVDGSRFADTWEWDFEDDGVVDATGQVPSPFIYPGPGRYTCELEVENIRGPDETDREINVIVATSVVTGDASGDGVADAADAAAVVVELHDGDPPDVATACQAFATTDQSDADGDTIVALADLVALVAGMF